VVHVTQFDTDIVSNAENVYTKGSLVCEIHGISWDILITEKPSPAK